MAFMTEPQDLLVPADVAPVLLMAGADALHGELPPQEPAAEPMEGLLPERPEEGLHEPVEAPAEEPLLERAEARADAPVEEEVREAVEQPAQDALVQESTQESRPESMQESAQEASGEADADAVEVGFRKVFRAVQRALQMASYLPAEPPGLTRVAVVSRQGRLIASAALDSPSQARFLLDQLQALGFEERSSTEEIQKLGCDLLVVHTANLEVGEVQGIVKGLKGERWPPEG